MVGISVRRWRVAEKSRVISMRPGNSERERGWWRAEALIVSAVLVNAWLTTCGRDASLPELAAKLLSPEYTAVIVCVPAESVDVT